MTRKKIEGGGFTIIELLVVIGIIAVLVVAALFILSPSQLASQGRDSNRIADLTSINQNVALYHETNPAGTLGTSTVLYISIPDPSATSTAGTNCASLGLPSAPSGDTYHCAASSTYRNNNGTGWIPVNFSVIVGNPLSALPIDPVNTTSSNEFYIYTASGTQYEVLANPEAQKTISNSSSSFIQGNDLALDTSFPTSGGTGGGTAEFTTSTYFIANMRGQGGDNSITFDPNTNSMVVVAAGALISVNDTTFVTSTYSGVSPNNGFNWISFDSHNNSIWMSGGHPINQIMDSNGAVSSYEVNTYYSENAFDSHNDSVWFVNQGQTCGCGQVTSINDTTYVTSTYTMPSDDGNAYAYGLVFDSHTNTVWMGNYSNIVEINDTTGAMYDHSAGPDSDDVTFDPHTNTIWAVNDNGTVTEMNDTTYASSSYPVGSSAYGGIGIAFDSSNDTIWVSNSNDDTVTEINDTTYASTTYAVGSYPGAIAFDSHNNTIWVSNSDGTVTIFTPNH